MGVTNGGSGAAGADNFFGGSYTHPDSGKSVFEVSDGVVNVNFYGVQTEIGSGSGQYVWKICDARGVDIDGALITSASGGSSSYGVYIFNASSTSPCGPSGETSNKIGPEGIAVRGLENYDTPNVTTTIDDTVNGVSLSAATFGHVDSWDMASRTFSNSHRIGVLGQSKSTTWAGTLSLSGGTGSFTFPYAYAQAPACLATDRSSANPVRCSTTTTTLSVTGSGSDIVNFVIIGNPN